MLFFFDLLEFFFVCVVSIHKMYLRQRQLLPLLNSLTVKRDGNRFESEYTLKFLVETGYEFIIFVRPSLPLKSISVQGSGVSFTDLSSGQENQIGCSKYSFTWSSTSIDPNKKKDRTNLPLLLSFQDGVNLSIPLQVKFYRQEDTQHVTWGTPLRQIDLECQVKAGATYVDIVKQVFR